MTDAVPAPLAAATVLLLRDGMGGIEILMQRRRASLTFLGGMWVFPGGRHEDSDRDAAVLERVRVERGSEGPRMRDLAGRELSREQTLGLYVTACRETFEECGVLLATDTRGTPAFASPEARWSAWREAVAERPAAFAKLLAQENLSLDVNRLVYWSHWITPAAEKRRFDTRFFAVHVPADLEPGPSDSESTEQRWIRPADAVVEVRAGKLAAAPPTIFTLENLGECELRDGNVDRLLAAERGRDIPPIRPVLVRTAEGLEVRMPWDAEYDPGVAEPLVRPAVYPGHFTRRPSRLQLDAQFVPQPK
jgi:8-oxo-dGTP pyrophosphatase MutT (NUDIX family)